VAGREDVTGIQADVRSRVQVQRGKVVPELGHSGAQHVSLPGHRLEQQVGAIVMDLVEQRQQALPDLPECRGPVTADRGPRVDDDTASADLRAPDEGMPE